MNTPIRRQFLSNIKQYGKELLPGSQAAYQQIALIRVMARKSRFERQTWEVLPPRPLGLRQSLSKLFKIRLKSLLNHPKLTLQTDGGLCAPGSDETVLIADYRPTLNGVPLDDLAEGKRQ